MLEAIIESDKIEKINALIATASNIVVTCHLAPDGDAMGSSVALMHILQKIGKKAHVVTPDMPPADLMFIPGAKEIVAASKLTDFATLLFEKADLIICLDFNAPHRVDRLSQHLLDSKAPKILIDHHTAPSIEADVVVSRPEISSTCMLLFRVIAQLGWMPLVDKTVATCIYTGMMTDTGNFSYNSLDPDLYTVVAELVRRGVDKDRIYKLAFNTKTENQLRLNGFAVAERMKLYREHQAALIVLRAEDLERFHYRPGDTEGLVNIPLSMPEINLVVYLRQEKDYIKVSSRSEGNIPVNELCSRYFNGGGHINASGGEFPGTMDEAIETFEKALPEFDKYLSDPQTKNKL